MPQQTYNPALVTVSVAGITLTQFAKGTFVTVEFDADAFSDDVGTRGEVVRIRSADPGFWAQEGERLAQALVQGRRSAGA